MRLKWDKISPDNLNSLIFHWDMCFPFPGLLRHVIKHTLFDSFLSPWTSVDVETLFEVMWKNLIFRKESKQVKRHSGLENASVFWTHTGSEMKAEFVQLWRERCFSKPYFETLNDRDWFIVGSLVTLMKSSLIKTGYRQLIWLKGQYLERIRGIAPRWPNVDIKGHKWTVFWFWDLHCDNGVLWCEHVELRCPAKVVLK